MSFQVPQGGNLKWLQDRTIFCTRSGSFAYGTNIEGSDQDYKGIVIPPREYFLGYSNVFEQAECKDPDSVIYDIRKFFKLAVNSNPNIIETLFTDPSDHMIVTPAGQRVLDNRDKFLSKRVKFTFQGYSFSQLKRIKTHRGYLLNPILIPPTRAEFNLPERTLIPTDQLMAAQAEIDKQLDRWEFGELESLEEAQKIWIKDQIHKTLVDIKVNAEGLYAAAARKIGFDDNFLFLLLKEREYAARKREFDQYQNWVKTRNPARAEMERNFGYDLKHANHLVRLMRMCKEMLTTGQVIVKRPDAEELISIRKGAWSYEQLIEWAEREDLEIEKAYNECNVLPKTADNKFLDVLCQDLVEESFQK
jgi:predicted nucleotidyltransferase